MRFLWLGLLGVIGTAVHGAAGPGPLTSVSMQTTGCVGSCPIYTYSAQSNGKREYHGIADVAATGVYRGSLMPDHWQAIAERVSALDVWRFKGEYKPSDCPSFWFDSAGATLTFRFENAEKTIVHYFGCEGFDGAASLFDFEFSLLDAESRALVGAGAPRALSAR